MDTPKISLVCPFQYLNSKGGYCVQYTGAGTRVPACNNNPEHSFQYCYKHKPIDIHVVPKVFMHVIKNDFELFVFQS